MLHRYLGRIEKVSGYLFIFFTFLGACVLRNLPHRFTISEMVWISHGQDLEPLCHICLLVVELFAYNLCEINVKVKSEFIPQIVWSNFHFILFWWRDANKDEQFDWILIGCFSYELKEKLQALALHLFNHL